MLRMLDLICTILNYYLALTLVRLLTSAFGWEFGVSRQYLRLLEWIFHLGQERIEKVESRQRLLDERDDQDEISARDEAGADVDGGGQTVARRRRLAFPPEKLDLELIGGGAPPDKDLQAHAAIANQPAARDPSGRGPAPDAESLIPIGRSAAADHAAAANSAGQAKVNPRGHSRRLAPAPSRRVSTPDGPPIFLLDDYEELSAAAPEGCGFAATGPAEACGRLDCLHEFHLLDAAYFVIKGVSAISDDQVTKRFTPEQLKTWNLLTRTNAKNYQFMSRSLGLCWLIGVLIRYVILLPLRIMFTLVGFVWLVCTMSAIGLLPESWRAAPYKLASQMAFRMLSCGITSRLKFHNRQYRARPGDICVANHTSPLDVVLLACDNCYALVGQRHGGLLGLLEEALSRATNHVWFDRGEFRDRRLVTQRLREHITSGKNLPVLIFPEGTCINNSAVMMFRKGSFETTNRVCPVAIKYDARFGDPFWNSSKHAYVQYLLLMMSSWAIKCDVWYLPPMERLGEESPADFANRVKAEIAKQGGLVDLAWDGQLKRTAVKPSWLYQQQEDYVKRLKID